MTGAGGKAIWVYCWEPEGGQLKGVVQIVHGMAEHAGRYRRFAEKLTGKGYAVVANDHRGHGMTERVFRGHIAGIDGFQLMADDIQNLYLQNMKKYGEVPRFILGHSMGAALTLSVLQVYPLKPDGVILSGLPAPKPLLLKAGKFISGLLGFIFNRTEKSPLIDKLMIGPANKHFKPERTPFEWLSRDYHEVNEYFNDPACGFIFSYAFYKSLFRGLDRVYERETIKQILTDIPFFLVSGKMDPIGDMGRGVNKIAGFLKETGIENIEVKLYEGARHELLNETNRDEVMDDLMNWIEERINAPSSETDK